MSPATGTLFNLSIGDLATSVMLIAVGFASAAGVWRGGSRKAMEARMAAMERVTDAQTQYISILVATLKAQVPPLDVPPPPVELLIHA